MDYSVEEIQRNVWRVRVASITRIVRYRSDSRTFAPWDVTTADGQVLFSTESLESAFRWIQARTGYPAEGLFAQALLEGNANTEPAGAGVSEESTATDVSRDALGN
jgi:hypothetical protein